ncbi:hypothetical protein D3C78_868180 [compost metagenome]
MIEHLEHRAAGFYHHIRRQAFAQQIVAGDGAVGQVDVSGVINDTAVDLFRHAHVKAAVAGFHVEGWNLSALGRDHRHAAVGIAQHQQRFRLHLGQHAIHGNDHIADGFRTAGAGSIEEMIRFADVQILEEDFIQLIIVVLPSMHQHMLAVLVQLGHDPRQTDDFRTRAHYGDHFQLFHCNFPFETTQASVPTGRA